MTQEELISWLHTMRKLISPIALELRMVAESRPQHGGAEITIAWRHLQEAKMFLGLSLGENNINPPWEKDGENK